MRVGYVGSFLTLGCKSENEHNRTSWVRTRFLKCYSPTRKPRHDGDSTLSFLISFLFRFVSFLSFSFPLSSCFLLFWHFPSSFCIFFCFFNVFSFIFLLCFLYFLLFMHFSFFDIFLYGQFFFFFRSFISFVSASFFFFFFFSFFTCPCSFLVLFLLGLISHLFSFSFLF